MDKWFKDTDSSRIWCILENKSVQVGVTDGYMFYQKCKDRCYQYKRNGISRIKKSELI